MNRQSPFYIILFMIAIAVVFGFGISFVNYATLPMLIKNETMHKNRVIAGAFMLEVAGTTAEDYERAVRDTIEPLSLKYEGKAIEAYRNRKTGEIGFVFSGFGFWDRITGIMVLSPDLETIRNLRFLEQKETPGLGARIEEGWFTDQFKGLSIAWGSPPGRRIVIGQSADAEAANRVDAITGATQTSMALMNVINGQLEIFRKSYEAQ